MNTEKFESLTYLYSINSIEGIGPQKIFSLLSKFKNFETLFSVGLNELCAVEGINKTLANKIIGIRSNQKQLIEKLEKEIADLEKFNGRLISYFDENYPDLLRNIYFPPIFLYVKGSFTDLDNSAIAIVGTREPTNYGRSSAEYFSKEITEKGLTTVSGLARGIDTVVHKTTLENGGRTIAIIGSGLDVVYPSENKKLFDQIAESGVIISEYPLKTKPDAQNFPRRNRIISGLGLGTLVIETKINGGAISTANYALDQGREVFAVPGNISSKYSEGTNALIQKGNAKLVTKVEDILTELRINFNQEKNFEKQKQINDLNLFEEKIYSAIKDGEKQIDEIALLTGLSTSDCLVQLLNLEFKGIVRQNPGKIFTID